MFLARVFTTLFLMVSQTISIQNKPFKNGNQPAYSAIKKNILYQPFIDSLEKTIVKKMADNGILGASVALVDDQHIVWAKGFGYTDSTRSNQVNEETLFSVQSISKIYTAAAFLMEAEKGRIKLDDAVIKYLPDFSINSRYGSNEAHKITFRHLLSHRAGLCHEAPIGNNYSTDVCSFEDHVKSISSSWLRFPIEKFYSYSSMGTDLAGYIMAKNAGQPFEDYMKEKLLSPLGMKHSSFNQNEAYKYSNLAKGHFGTREMEQTFIPALAAGGLYSNVNEMARFISFLLNKGRLNNHTVISTKLLQEMYRVQFPIKGQAAGYGLGVRVKPYYGGTLVHHAGGGYGYRAEQAWIPEYKIGVIILTNAANGSSFTNQLYEECLTGMIKLKNGSLPTKLSQTITKPIIDVAEKDLKKLAGTYKTNRNLVEIFSINNNLAIKFGRDTIPLSAHSGNEFSSSNGDLFIFYVDKKQRPLYFIHINQDNPDFYIFNDSSNDKPGAAKPSWNLLTGTYTGYNNRQPETINVFLKNGYLYCMAGGATKLAEYKPGIFFTADGESVILKKDTLYLGNRPYYKKNK